MKCFIVTSGMIAQHPTHRLSAGYWARLLAFAEARGLDARRDTEHVVQLYSAEQASQLKRAAELRGKVRRLVARARGLENDAKA